VSIGEPTIEPGSRVEVLRGDKVWLTGRTTRRRWYCFDEWRCGWRVMVASDTLCRRSGKPLQFGCAEFELRVVPEPTPTHEGCPT
jgi:hypothetical protein